MQTNLKRTVRVVYAMAVLMASTASAVVTHDDLVPHDRPADSVMVRWGVNASGVVISPEYILTTAHQGGGVGTPIVIGGSEYLAAEVYRHPDADLQVVRITDPDGGTARLADYVTIYNASEAGRSPMGLPVVIGGYGKGRGETLYVDSRPYGYRWGGNDNSTLRWGSNVIDGLSLRMTPVGLEFVTTQSVRAAFNATGDGDYLPHEAAVAEWDSGGGWFWRNDQDEWLLVGLSLSAARPSETRFGDPFWGVNVSAYGDWIVGLLPDVWPLMGDVNGDGVVDFGDFLVLSQNWGMTGATLADGDLNGSTVVDFEDFTLLSQHWGVPEPATGVITIASALVVVWGRRSGSPAGRK